MTQHRPITIATRVRYARQILNSHKRNARHFEKLKLDARKNGCKELDVVSTQRMIEVWTSIVRHLEEYSNTEYE